MLMVGDNVSLNLQFFGILGKIVSNMKEQV